MRRRDALVGLWGLVGLQATEVVAQQSEECELVAPVRSVNVLDLGADRTGRQDSSAAFQAAIDQLIGVGGRIYVPAGEYRLERTLVLRNFRNARSSGVLIQGDGQHASFLRSTIKAGPLIRVRGVPDKGPISTTFIWGGGLQDISLDGRLGGADHDAIEVLGWWNARITLVRIFGFSGHGIRAVVDRDVNPNPDYSASMLIMRFVQIERCGGWGFLDDTGQQGAPNWSWDRCYFNLCKSGGVFLQSSAHSFVKCAFMACGWQDEKSPPAAEAWGLFLGGALTASSRHWIEGCEFDSNLTAHIGIRFLSASSFVNNRFIFNDRFSVGHLCPGAGIQIGVGDSRAAIRSIEFRQSVFRFDQGGGAVAFDWLNSANVRDIEIRGSVFMDNSGNALRLERYRGNDPGGQGGSFGYVIQDRDANPRGKSCQ